MSIEMTLTRSSRWFVTALCVFAISSYGSASTQKTSYQPGIINLFNDHGKENLQICMFYADEYYHLQTVPEKRYNLSYKKTIDLCQDDLTKDDFTPTKNDSLILLSVSTNCSISHYYKTIREGKSSGVILLSNYTASLNQSYGWDVTAIVRRGDIPKLLNSIKPGTDAQVEVTSMTVSRFDASLIILWFIAVFCVAVGSFSGPYFIIKSSEGGEHDTEALGADSEPKDSHNEGKVYDGITVPVAIGLVLFISTTLLLLYFYYQYFVYFFIGVFCIASSRAMYLLSVQLLEYLMPIRFPKIWKFGIHEIFFGIASISVAIVWFVYRHDGWVWGLQDLLGVCFCIHLIQTLHLPNMKIVTCILVLLFVYDVFFVFITPYFTSNGKSIMVEVATGVSGSGSREQLPMLLQVPRLDSSSQICSGGREYSLLGFGDIIVPGFLVCFAHAFDLQTRTDGKNRPYFITSLIAYSVGLGGAFIALILSSSGQPALFYIVPSILLGIFTLGLIKKEVKALWRGVPLIHPVEHESS